MTCPLNYHDYGPLLRFRDSLGAYLTRECRRCYHTTLKLRRVG